MAIEFILYFFRVKLIKINTYFNCKKIIAKKMAGINNKLSLHIAEKNLNIMNSGFVDVTILSVINTKFTLNRQTIAVLNIGGGAGPISPITFVSAHALNGCASYTCPPPPGSNPCGVVKFFD